MKRRKQAQKKKKEREKRERNEERKKEKKEKAGITSNDIGRRVVCVILKCRRRKGSAAEEGRCKARQGSTEPAAMSGILGGV